MVIIGTSTEIHEELQSFRQFGNCDTRLINWIWQKVYKVLLYLEKSWEKIMNPEIYFLGLVESIHSRENATFAVLSAPWDSMQLMKQFIFWKSLFRFGILKKQPCLQCLILPTTSIFNGSFKKMSKFPTLSDCATRLESFEDAEVEKLLQSESLHV